MRRRSPRGFGELLDRADDEVLAALDSLASLLQPGARRPRSRPSKTRSAELHRDAWALGMRVAMSGGAGLLDPELRAEAERVRRLWQDLEPAARLPAEPEPPAPTPGELLAAVDEMRRRLGDLQDRVCVEPLRRRARR